MQNILCVRNNPKFALTLHSDIYISLAYSLRWAKCSVSDRHICYCAQLVGQHAQMFADWGESSFKFFTVHNLHHFTLFSSPHRDASLRHFQGSNTCMEQKEIRNARHCIEKRKVPVTCFIFITSYFNLT